MLSYCQIPFVIDWVPVFQFFVYTCVCTPPNYLWYGTLTSPRFLDLVLLSGVQPVLL